MSLSKSNPFKPKQGSDRSFGIIFSFVALIAGFMVSPEFVGASLLLFLISLGFFAVSFSKPSLLSRLNNYWMRFGLFLGRFISPVALALIYSLSVLPVAFLMRIFRRNHLDIVRSSEAKTYWVRREDSAHNMEEQF